MRRSGIHAACCTNWNPAWPVSNRRNISSDNSRTARVAPRATARPAKRAARGTNTKPRAARSGIRMMVEIMAWLNPAASFPEHDVKQDHHPRREEEGVGLQIARLGQAQGAAQDVGASAQAPDHQAGHQPAVAPV